MQQEFDALKNNDTCRIIDLLVNKKALCYKWVYRVKYK